MSHESGTAAQGGRLKSLNVRPVWCALSAEAGRSAVLPGVEGHIDQGPDSRRIDAAQTADETTLSDYLPDMDDVATQPLRELEIQSRELEVRKVLALVNYVEEFKSTREWDRRAAGIDGRNKVTVVDDQGEVWRYWTEDKLANADEDAAIMYAAQAFGWSEYRAGRLYDNAVTSRDELPKLWEWFRDARVTVLAMGKVAQASRKLLSKESLGRLNERAPKKAAGLRPTELDHWLKRFLANAEPEQHEVRFVDAARQRYVSVRPAEDHDGMSVLTALLPTVTAQAIAGKLRSMARSHIQPVPHNPVIIEPGQETGAAGEGSSEVPADMAAAGYTVSEDEWLRHQVEEIFAGMEEELPPSETGSPSVAAPTSYIDGDQRSLAQREADLLGSWLLSAEQVESFPIEAQIGLLVPVGTLTGESAAPGITRDRSDAVPARVIRQLVTDPANRIRWHQYRTGPEGDGDKEDFDVLSHVYSGYKVPNLLRQAVWFRDGVCAAPGCTVPAERGDIDHITAWPEGKTQGSNLQVLCRRHHRVKTAGHQFTT